VSEAKDIDRNRATDVNTGLSADSTSTQQKLAALAKNDAGTKSLPTLDGSDDEFDVEWDEDAEAALADIERAETYRLSDAGGFMRV
jgi:hypothetical protein